MLERPAPASLIWLAALIALAVVAAGVGGLLLYTQAQHAARVQADAMTGGHWRQGRSAMARYGCGSCHVIPGIAGANGRVGPDLTHVGQRAEIAGMLVNTPEMMVAWLVHPQRLVPGNGMPELGVTDADARDIAAYLYAQK